MLSRIRIAYIISAYKNPGQLIRLVKKLNTPTTSFFVHVDKKTDDRAYREVVEGLSDHQNVHFLRRHVCYWGDFGHVKATLKGIHEISKNDSPFDYAILLTGQDYPIKSNETIERVLRESGGKSFIESFPVPGPEWGENGLDRIERWHFHLPNRHIILPQRREFKRLRFLGPLWSLLFRISHAKRKFPNGLKPYGGSAYWCLSRECVEYIHDFTRQNQKFVNFFKYAHIPDEIFFQTILLNSPLKENIVNDDLRYTDWTRSVRGSPGILTKEDFSKMMSSDKLFARKFDPDLDADVLDMIDREIAGAFQKQARQVF